MVKVLNPEYKSTLPSTLSSKSVSALAVLKFTFHVPSLFLQTTCNPTHSCFVVFYVIM